VRTPTFRFMRVSPFLRRAPTRNPTCARCTQVVTLNSLKDKNIAKGQNHGAGCYTPPRVLTNQDLEKMVATNDQWIMERVGIRERHIADPGVATSDMAWRPRAARWSSAAWILGSRGHHCLHGHTGLHVSSTACLVQNGLGAKGAWGST